jgi:hypothetical protein
MRLHLPAATVALLLLAACGGAPISGPSAADKPGGATNMQPGSGGSINYVVRSEGNGV